MTKRPPPPPRPDRPLSPQSYDWPQPPSPEDERHAHRERFAVAMVGSVIAVVITFLAVGTVIIYGWTGLLVTAGVVGVPMAWVASLWRLTARRPDA